QVNKGNHCIVGGFSMGARYALEVSHQLKKAGLNIDLLILLDPSEKDRKLFRIGNTVKRFISNFYFFTNITPPESFKTIHVFQYHRTLRNKYKISKYDGKVLLFQRRLDIPFEEREWPKITTPDNLIFHPLDLDDHFEVVSNSDIQLQWANKIKECIY
ncbi:MAG: hypothetical protein Q8Q54_06465, partial [Methylococcales bacterium]|nr:hypothetical protein [Methylococcales bacterium]